MKKLFLSIVVFIGLLIAASSMANAAVSKEKYLKSIDFVIERIFNNYHFRVIYQDALNPNMRKPRFQFAEPKEYKILLRYLLLFEEEIQKYPKKFFVDGRLKGIVLVKTMFNKENPAEGIYDYKTKMIYMDFLRSQGRKIAQQHNIHHEIYHFIEYEAIGRRGWQDLKWMKFNPEGFKYGHLEEFGKNARTDLKYSSQEAGFVSPYSMTAMKEDKAEIFACLMVESQHKLMHKWAIKDRILENKIKYMKDFMSLFSDHIDEQFFDKLFKYRKNAQKMNIFV